MSQILDPPRFWDRFLALIRPCRHHSRTVYSSIPSRAPGPTGGEEVRHRGPPQGCRTRRGLDWFRLPGRRRRVEEVTHGDRFLDAEDRWSSSARRRAVTGIEWGEPTPAGRSLK